MKSRSINFDTPHKSLIRIIVMVRGSSLKIRVVLCTAVIVNNKVITMKRVYKRVPIALGFQMFQAFIV